MSADTGTVRYRSQRAYNSISNGSDCRIGQVVLGWAYDAGKSRTDTDRISWKWFYPDAPKVLQVDAAIASDGHVAEDLWPCKLCEKEITGGNLKLHKN